MLWVRQAVSWSILFEHNLIDRHHSRCPAADLVESSIWLLIVTMLAVFDFSKTIDDNGKTIEPEIVYDNLVFRWVALIGFV
jgi:hypothetical protein